MTSSIYPASVRDLSAADIFRTISLDEEKEGNQGEVPGSLSLLQKEGALLSSGIDASFKGQALPDDFVHQHTEGEYDGGCPCCAHAPAIQFDPITGQELLFSAETLYAAEDAANPVAAVQGTIPLLGADRSDIKVAFLGNRVLSRYGGFESVSDAEWTGEEDWTSAEIAIVLQALSDIADFLDVGFSVVSDPASAELQFLKNDDSGSLGTAGLAWGSTAIASVRINHTINNRWASGKEKGGQGYETLVHEIGHALGLGHTHDNGFGSDILPGMSSANQFTLGPDGINDPINSIMAYNDGWYAMGSSNLAYGNRATFGAWDVQALINRYGANSSANSGDTTYTLPETAAVGSYFTTIVDTGGTDTISAGGTSSDTIIDLRAATLDYDTETTGGPVSYIEQSAPVGGFTIASGSLIENAIGGSGEDLVWANDAANSFALNASADFILGSASALDNDELTDGEAGDSFAFLGESFTVSDVTLASVVAGVATLEVDISGTITTLLVSGAVVSGGTLSFSVAALASGTLLTLGAIAIGGVRGDVLTTGMIAASGGVVMSDLDVVGERDWYAITVQEGRNYTFELNGHDNGNGALGDTYLRLLSLDGTLIDQNDDANGLFSELTYTATATETLFLSVGAYNDGEAGGYELLSSEEFNSTTGDDSLVGGETADNIDGLAGNDTLRGNGANDTLTGNTGNDLLIGGEGADSLDGGDDSDTASYEGSSAGVSVDLQNATAMNGDAAGDVLTAIEHLEGSDHVDVLRGDGSANSLSGMDGDDVLYGRDGADTLTGGLGNDVLQGQAGADELLGGENDDTLLGGADADTVNGGNGSDTAWYAGSSVGVSIDLLAGTAANGDAAGDMLTSIENLIGSSRQDFLRGSNDANVINGGDSSDRIYGRGGNDDLAGGAGGDLIRGQAGDDTISGGDGRDFIYGGSGADSIDGGDDVDTVGYTNSTAGISIDLYAGTASGGNATGDVLTGIENIQGSRRQDDLRGDNDANLLDGDNGSDSFYGRGGNDTLIGGAQGDLLRGQDGEYLLEGGVDNDFLYGGADADTFAFYDGDGVDVIGDYEDGTDTIDLSGTSATQFSDLTITANGGNALIDYGAGTIELTGISDTVLDAGDFDF